MLVACLVTGALLLAALGGWWWRRRGGWARGAAGGGVPAPGPGPLTTLCITDVENSTPLW